VELETIVDTSEEDVGFKASVATNLKELVHAAGVQATQEVFTEQILPQAKADSPVGVGPDDPHPGKNRDSIKVSFRDNPETGWISAWIFTESGYGWLLEHGTSHNRELTRKEIKRRHGKVPKDDRTAARPYIFPAILQFVANIADRARELLESM
jgi:hypothetical protein